MGPPPISQREPEQLRYAISGLVDEIRDPRSKSELVAVGAKLFEALANYHLRTHGFWSGKGKFIPRD